MHSETKLQPWIMVHFVTSIMARDGIEKRHSLFRKKFPRAITFLLERGAGGLLKSNWNSNWALEAPRLCSTWCTRGSISGESVSLLDPPAAKEACVPCWDLAPSDFQFLCKFMESCAIIESCSSKKELFAQHHPTEVASDDQTNSCFPNSSPRLAWILF